MRKILIIILVTLLLILAGVYFFYFRPRVQSGQPVPNILTSFFPKVTSSGDSFGADDSANTIPGGNTGTATTSSLKQVTGRAIAGYTLFALSTKVSVPSTDPKAAATITTVTDNYVRYVSRSNGYVYDIKNTEIPLQVSNITIPNVYEAFFADNNNTAILRFLRPDAQTIATYSVPVPPLNTDGTRTQLSGTYLPDDIASLAVSADQTKIARLISDGTNVTLTSSTSTGKAIKALYKSPFTSWLPQWNASGLYLQTKAASIADGYLYAVDQSSARLKRLIGNVKGLTASVSPLGNYIIYSESNGTDFNTKILNTKTNIIATLTLKILPEKCTWLKNEDLICAGNSNVAEGNYPDAWYAGTTHFTDQLYRITPSTNTYTVLFNDDNHSFDMSNLQVDEGQQFIYFIDKSTGILWRTAY